MVEKRVLGEVSVALTDYRNTYNAYPWLSPFADPRSSTLTGTASPGSAGVTLSDTSTDFINLGVRPGDAVQNTTDGSSGIIATVTSTSVTVNRLLGGASNTFFSRRRLPFQSLQRCGRSDRRAPSFSRN